MDQKRRNIACGRKFCSICKRWRHLCDFTVRKWEDEPECTRPRWFASECRTCNVVKTRERNGYNRRDPSNLSKEEKLKKRREQNRRSAQKRRENAAYRAVMNEYSRIWYSAKKAEKEAKELLTR